MNSWHVITEQGDILWEDAWRIKDYFGTIEPLMWLSLQALSVTETMWQKDSSFRGEIAQAKPGPQANANI